MRYGQKSSPTVVLDASALTDPIDAMAIEPSTGDLFLHTVNSTTVKRFSSAGMRKADFVTAGAPIFGDSALAFDSSGALYMVSTSISEILRVPATGGAFTAIATIAGNGASGIAIVGSTMFLADLYGNQILKMS